MKETGALKKLFLILILVVLLPAIFYSGYEINSISTSEELIASIYRQQLDVILFSLNQYALDVVTNWSSSLGILSNENKHVSQDSLKHMVGQFLEKHSSIQAIVFTDTSLGDNRFFSSSENNIFLSRAESSFAQALQSNKEKIERVLRYQKVEYRKLEPIQIGREKREESLGLVFVTSDGAGEQTVVTIILDEQTFIREILSAKLREAAAEEFVLAVTTTGAQQPVFSTSSLQANEMKQQKQLWLFPNYYLGIALTGESIEEITQSRFRRNLVLIILLDIVLAIGVWIVYRNIKRQMEFVRLKTDFVSNVSHELRTPLSLIRMYAETLEMDRIKQEEKKREYYSTILQETERLTRLINNILDFSKMEAGKKQYNSNEIDLNSIISEILDTYYYHLESEGFETKVELQQSLPIMQGDKEAIAEAIMNVLDNAIKYSSSTKEIRVATGVSGKTMFVEIEDKGIGIAAEHHKKIFENFFRVSSGLVHNVKGSGLGLALVKHIMDGHNGRVIVKSAPGKGSTFRLEFPYES
ncbi:MAG: hypothetical protein EPO24_03395 [Bacteroidetes bacterium]|nr:MAG: hypothetical protein EPO24_03395 [Bacteroidota bacterium]